MNRSIAIAAPLLLVVAWMSPTSASAVAVQETCQGRPATIVGTAGQPIEGTEQDDVIVANGASKVLALGGDDTICVNMRGTDLVQAGPGADSVDGEGTADGHTVVTALGSGADSFVGGRAFDVVYGDTKEPGSDTERDTISTGPGRDRIFSGAPGMRNNDVIDSGADADVLNLRGRPGSGGSIVTGSTSKADDLTLLDPKPAKWKVVMGQRGRLTANGVSVPVTGGYRLDVGNLSYRQLVIRGSAFSDVVLADRTKDVEQGRFVARLQGGVDAITVRTGMTGTIVGASKRDFVRLVGPRGERAAAGAANINLSMGRIRSDGAVLRIRGFESMEAHGFQRVEYTGTSGADDFYAVACAGFASGLGGSDDLALLATEKCKGSHPGVTLHGGGGSDELLSGTGGDVLIGGPGRDQGDGGAGRDRCRGIEIRRSC